MVPTLISEIRVENFLRLDNEVKVPLGRLTVLVGENGSGKSSVLKAVHWGLRCATLADSKGKVTLDQMDYVPSKDFLSLGHKFKLQNTEAGRKMIVSFLNQDLEKSYIQINAGKNDAGVRVKFHGALIEQLTNDTKPSSAFIPGLAGVSEDETILAMPVLHRKAASGEGGATLRQIMLQCSGSPDGTGESYLELNDLSKWVGEVMPGVKFWVKFDKLRDRHIDVKFLTPDMKISGQREQVSWKSLDMAGTGFLQVVQIFAYLLCFKPKLLLIDEPDAHLHPSRQQALIKALDKATREFQETQVIISTHAPSLVRALPKDAKIYWMSDGKVKNKDVEVREKMGWNVLDKDLIIFTEDGSLENLDNILASRPDLHRRCLLWPTFGKDSLPDGKKIKSIRKRLGVKVLIHRDRDFMSDADIIEWASKRYYDTNNVPYWITPGSDIESCFLDINHIARSLEVDLHIAEEIDRHAFAKFSEEDIVREFENAYRSAVAQIPERSAIIRLGEMGGISRSTIKGKLYLKELLKSCVHILPSHGLGRNVGKRDLITQPNSNSEIALDLLHKINDLLES